MEKRLARFEEKLAQSEVDAVLVTGQNNIYYLTGFWGTEATIFISGGRRLFLQMPVTPSLRKRPLRDLTLLKLGQL